MSSVQITGYLKKIFFYEYTCTWRLYNSSHINIKQSLRNTRNDISMSCQGKVATKTYQSINESFKVTTNFIKQSWIGHLTPLSDVLNFHRFFIKRGGDILSIYTEMSAFFRVE